MIDKEVTFQNNLKYIFKSKKSDRSHLLVIFSGYGGRNDITYDFIGSTLSYYQGAILWIKDDTEGYCSYYLSTKRNPDFERSVIALIYQKLNKLGIDKSKCTLLGASKGGSAAIYYGIKYNFKNIIASCPQLKIGQHIKETRLASLKYLFDENIDNEESRLNTIIFDVMEKDHNLYKNIYLISSPHDYQYKTHIAPFVCLFEKYQNFNYLLTSSELAYQHNLLTRYNLPLILSIIYALADNAFPKYGFIQNGDFKSRDHIDALILNEQRNKSKLVCNLDKVVLDNGLMHISGVSLIRGYECIDYSHVKSQILIIKSKDTNLEIQLGKKIDRDISSRFFDEEFIDYRACGFASFKQGIDLNELQVGCYELFIKTTIENLTLSKLLSSESSTINKFSISGNYEVVLISDAVSTKLIKRPLINKDNDFYFALDSIEVKSLKFFITGLFSVRGIECKNWEDLEYYLSFKSENNQFSYRLGKVSNLESDYLYDFDFGSYDKSKFATIKYEGVDINNIIDDEYNIYVLLSNGKSLFKYKLNYKLTSINHVFQIVEH